MLVSETYIPAKEIHADCLAYVSMCSQVYRLWAYICTHAYIYIYIYIYIYTYIVQT